MVLGFFIDYASSKILDKAIDIFRAADFSIKPELIEISDEFGDIEPLLEFYIEPNCQNINPADFFENEADAVVKTPIFGFLNDFFNQKIFTEADGRNQLFILSDAGIGKSSLLIMIKLCSMIARIRKDYDVAKNPVELIKLNHEALGTVRSLENKSETILLLDAFDEDPLAWEKPEKRLLKVLQASKNFKRVIISCRTQFFPEKGVKSAGSQEKISIGGFNCPILFLSPFSQNQVNAYLEKRFPENGCEQNIEKKAKAVSLINSVKTLLFRPFLLAHIEDLIESNNQSWNQLSLYDELLNVWIRRELRKKTKLKIEANDLIISGVSISVKMQEVGERHLTKTALDKIIKNIPSVSSILQLEHGSKSLLNKTSDGGFRFSHFSIQEFFVALYIIILGKRYGDENLHKAAKQIPVQRKNIRLTSVTLEFLSICNDSAWLKNQPYDLTDYDLDGFDFSDSHWHKSNFSNSSLRDCKFDRGYFSEVNFSNSTMNGASFNDSTLEDCQLQNSNLERSEFRMAKLKGSSFKSAKLNNADFKGATDFVKYDKSTNFNETTMPDGKKISSFRHPNKKK